MKLHIIVLEDDYFDWEWMSGALSEQFPGAESEWIATEKAFIERLHSLAENPPDVFVLDVMVPWDRPQKDQEEIDVPDDVRSGGFYTAGLRCLDRIHNIPALAQIPCVLYTGLDANNFTDCIVHTKSEDMRPLADEIRAQLANKAK